MHKDQTIACQMPYLLLYSGLIDENIVDVKVYHSCEKCINFV